jgi:hypothetical protein
MESRERLTLEPIARDPVDDEPTIGRSVDG